MTGEIPYPESPPPAFLFDLDGTLIDSVYQHVLAWRAALSAIGIDLSVWRIHRRIGMSGGLFVTALLRETGRTLSRGEIEQLQKAHAAEYSERSDSVGPLPGAAVRRPYPAGTARPASICSRVSSRISATRRYETSADEPCTIRRPRLRRGKMIQTTRPA